ncbi:MAG: glutamate racemase [Deltaproteobacteria bacterium]|nr:glutamate racemase [Deltaproteobacteria bacterium]
MRRPIGIFDSGIGGLTVLKEVIRVLPHEDTIYLGDTARVPYGTKSPDTVIKYSLENARFLLRFNIKALVVACNTASAFALTQLSMEMPIPVIGVIYPGAKKALSTTKNKKIGIIGTEGTIKSNSYVNAINDLCGKKSVVLKEHGERGFNRYFEVKINSITLFTKACPIFVPLSEEGWIDNEVAFLTAKTYLTGLKDKDIDTLILGCTHYPILKDVITNIIGKEIILVDSGQETAVEVSRVLQDKGILENDLQLKPSRRFFVTDSPERFIMVGSRFIGAALDNVDKVDVTQSEVSPFQSNDKV